MRTLFVKALALHHSNDKLVGKGTDRKSSAGAPMPSGTAEMGLMVQERDPR